MIEEVESILGYGIVIKIFFKNLVWFFLIVFFLIEIVENC